MFFYTLVEWYMLALVPALRNIVFCFTDRRKSEEKLTSDVGGGTRV
jgi:hypothetical protein